MTARHRRIVLWRIFVATLLLGAGVIFGMFELYMHSVDWQGAFPVSVYASAAAAWGVALVCGVAVLEIFGVVRFGAPRLAVLRVPWLPFVALIVGIVAGFFAWK